MNIAYIGNFEVSFSTENDVKWSLEKLGHDVITLQENKVSADEVVSASRERGVRLLIWTHTHSWPILGDNYKMLDQLRASGIKTCSFHLDRFWGLEALDGRESRIGQHAFWKTDMVFTADGGNDQKFKDRGVNHVWMQPAVVERDCYFGSPSLQFNSPLCFAGADFYHPEYPFRTILVNQLREVYGANFRVYQGIREAALNNLYATVRVVVGDHCFAGAPNYWSDRVPETIGRGGFLIAPETPGLSIPGLVTYEPQNIEDLRKKINYFIDDDHQVERNTLRNLAHEDVKKNHTYTQRMIKLLEVMNAS